VWSIYADWPYGPHRIPGREANVSGDGDWGDTLGYPSQAKETLMGDVTQFPAQPEAPSIIGPERCGNVVIVEGRAIPLLICHDRGDDIELVLDNRFSITVPKPAYDIAWMVATALAIGAGYSHIRAENKDQPFAPIANLITDGEHQ
jgi:hypothetical protein